jgi:hypothetical protein
MSWGIGSFFGRAPSVREQVVKAFTNQGKCAEPEETIKQVAAQIIDAALAGQDPGQVVEVSASGSMHTTGGKVTSNTLNIAVTPRYGFLE